MRRGQVYWLDFGEPDGHQPAKRRPVVVVQCAALNRSAIGTVIVASLTTRAASARFPGATTIPAGVAGLPRDSVLKPTEISTVNRSALEGPLGQVPATIMAEIDRCLRFALDL
ncbi:MAG: type II toxin-antitoxin system PemK/MazF family toxin [Bifidobacteriaceae bacterium]|nr:type II toxin-antitoxin system PemK/MazF family toxin [Bifidobacteriaceae bacterium]